MTLQYITWYSYMHMYIGTYILYIMWANRNFKVLLAYFKLPTSHTFDLSSLDNLRLHTSMWRLVIATLSWPTEPVDSFGRSGIKNSSARGQETLSICKQSCMAVIQRILTFALELKVIIIICSAFLAQICGVQLVRDLYKGLTAESSHGFGTAPHTTWPSKGLSLIYLVFKCWFYRYSEILWICILVVRILRKARKQWSPHVAKESCPQPCLPPVKYLMATTIPCQGNGLTKGRLEGHPMHCCCFFVCDLRWIAVCLEDGSSATKAAELEKDLLTSCACWCKCLGFEACALLHQLTG